ncbi:MAG: class I SAM-dependent rRNA methyltransferase, partial [Gemmatimonadetes bacterium]|nr:class I SAM-dependent rRNA methyltransferase [Gemmatimonadota bacterium]
MEKIIVSPRGARRWRRGHPWIYRSDVERSDAAPGVVRAEDTHGNFLGQALWSPPSEISLRFLTSQETPVDGDWWHDRMAEALAVRDPENLDATGYRVVHAEGDSLPSLIVDKYGEIVVVQLLSAGLEAVRGQVLAAIDTVVNPKSILLRNDASVRRHEDLPLEVEEIRGPIPEFVEVREGAVRYLVAPHTGQKTGSFLDQRENRVLMAGVAHGRTLDLFTYQGLFALQMARRAESVVAVDSSAAALEVAAKNAELNGLDNLEWVEANVFDLL